MKIKYTHIVGVESDMYGVLIKVRLEDSDSADLPLSVRVTPHNNYIHVNMSCMGDKAISKIENGPNIVNIYYQ